jgi:phosphate starvation-inducible membrane PsiE
VSSARLQELHLSQHIVVLNTALVTCKAPNVTVKSLTALLRNQQVQRSYSHFKTALAFVTFHVATLIISRKAPGRHIPLRLLYSCLPKIILLAGK